VTRSTSPAIASDGVRGWGEEAVILIEVYAVEVHLGAVFKSGSARAAGRPGCQGNPGCSITQRFTSESSRPHLGYALRITLSLALQNRHSSVRAVKRALAAFISSKAFSLTATD
jgi:hypothetical protein